MKKILSILLLLFVVSAWGGVVNRHPRSPQPASASWAYTELMQTLTTSTADAWTDIDLSAYIPKGAVANIVIHQQESGSSKYAQYAGARINGSALERKMSISTYTTVGCNGFALPVKTDANGLIEYYNDDTTNITFTLIGYWTGIDYTEAFSATFNNTTVNTWQDADITDYAPDGRVVTIGMVANATPSVYYIDMGVRTNGSSLARIINIPDNGYAGDYSSSTMTVKSDSNGIIETWSGDLSETTFQVLGYFGAAMDYVESFQDISITSYDAWTDKDLSAYMDQDGRLVEIMPKNTDNINNLGGARTNGSGLDRYFDLETRNGNAWIGLMIPTRTDGSGIVELYADAASVDHILFGYFK